MYKILVVSDTHKKIGPVIDLMGRIKDLNQVLHLGDLVVDATDIEALGKVPVNYVAGNCDFYEQVPMKKTLIIQEKRFFLTHGHEQGVKYSLDTLKQLGRQNKFDVMLFGHTHVPFIGYHDEILIMNPGSVSLPRDSSKASYGIIQIDDEGRIHATLNEYKKSF